MHQRIVQLLSTLVLFFTFQNSFGQGSIYKAISDAEKTVFTITSYNRGGGVIGKSVGFFINNQGLAICRASIFVGADSLKIVDARELGLRVEKIISTHQPTDLAIVKMESIRKSRFDFLFPTSSLFREEEELLIFSDPDLKTDGAVLERVKKVVDKPFLNRTGLLNTNIGVKSYGAPVINSKGELVGVIGYLKEESPSLIFNCATLTDTAWISVNIPFKKIKESAQKQAYMLPHLSRALLSFALDDYIGAAKNLTAHLKIFTNSSMAYALRGYSRYMYNNKEESKTDFATGKRISNTSYLLFYYQSLVAQREKKLEQAYKMADSSVYYQPKFHPSRVLRGNLTLETNRSPNDALLDYSYAIQINPQYAEGYYYRALYLLDYTQNFDLAYSDMATCIDLDPSQPNVYMIKGQLDMQRENYFEAQKNLNKALQKAPTNDKILFNRAIVNYHLGLTREACEDWKKASDLGNQDAMNYLLKYCHLGGR